ncbi:MAG: hypothetical protein E6J53_05320 [Chloroflexi bacterium]|nr:MAG: hypothetical protein E6J53_05320 [Chloroflexota bacterium]
MHRPAVGAVDIGTGFSHIPVQVDDLPATLGRLSEAGLKPGPVERPGGQDGPQISWLTDPDGYRIELVQLPLNPGLHGPEPCVARVLLCPVGSSSVLLYSDP